LQLQLQGWSQANGLQLKLWQVLVAGAIQERSMRAGCCSS
jgi:hypothetical protein